MYKVMLGDKSFFVESGEILSDVLMKNGVKKEHPCGGMGVCKKCLVSVNGKKMLSCQYKIESDISVQIDLAGEYLYAVNAQETGSFAENAAFVLDIGTTTLALALVDLEEKKIIGIKTASNPQRVFGADVISRIDYCTKNGVSLPQEVLISEVKKLVDKFAVKTAKKMYVAGNATMLHIFMGVNPMSIGTAPYTPVFLETKTERDEIAGFFNVEEIVLLPSFSSFVGADLTAGINFVPKSSAGKYNLLIDLGTNAEIVLYSDEKILCTAAAAGPCFEGANISCGMSAVSGAVSEFSSDGKAKTIGNEIAKGICGTGLIDIISVLLEKGVVDKTGFMQCNEYEISSGVFLTQEDVRQYQLAKSAVCSAVLSLIKKCKIQLEEIEKVFISGGFSSKINISNAVKTGLFPKELQSKCVSVGNSSLLGAVKYACEENNLSEFIKKSEYVDLSCDVNFSDLFIENMMF